MTSLFAPIAAASLDPIMRLFEAFNNDPSDTKLNLVVGVYTDASGRIPVLRAVQTAEKEWIAQGKPKSYRPIEGAPGYRKGVQSLLFGPDSAVIRDQRAVTLQSVGGTGALKIGADVLKQLSPDATVAISSPSWENHRALFQEAGFKVVDYPYYDPTNHGVDFDAMTAFIETLAPGSIVVLHACCHNPTGNDLNAEQWKVIVDLIVKKGLTPFVDIAYQGFGSGLQEDALAVRLLADTGVEFFVASSFSKSFSLYGERVGAITLVAKNRQEATQAEGLAKRLVRTNYSNPPTHGAVIVESVLQTPALRTEWEAELASMRQRIRAMRVRMADDLDKKIPGRSFQFIKQQNGMFSYSGLTASQARALRERFGIYMLDTGRICVAALNDSNIDRVVDAIVQVHKD